MTPDIPAIDLTAWRTGSPPAALIDTVDRALRTTGFLVIDGHGIPADLAAEVRALSLDFFHLPAEVKATYQEPTGVPGWHGLGREAAAYVSGTFTPPDLKETAMFVAERGSVQVDARGPFDASNKVIPDVPGLVDAAQRYVACNEVLAQDLLALLAQAMGDVDGTLLAGASRPMASLNVNWYPALGHVGSVEPGQFRVGPHDDYGTVTILDRQPGVGCLQVQRADGVWIDAPYEPGTLIVNLGDLMAHWTGGRWRSSTHRVLPPDASAPDEELVSLVYFVESNIDAVIEPLPPPIGGGAWHEPVNGGEWLRQRLDAISL
jgi:isopenicillin N synthase-like dioxygenase